MSVAALSHAGLKVFSAEDSYAQPVSVNFSSGNRNHGRITWSGDGKWLASAPFEKGGGPLPIYKYSDKKLQPLKYVNLSNISSACFFNWTNRNIAVGNEKGEIFVWDIKEKKIGVKVVYLETNPVDFIAVNSEDSYIASASLATNKISLHGLKTNKVLNTITLPKSNHISSLKFCLCKKNYLGASSIESTVCVWDILRSEYVFKTLNSHCGACTDISFSPINNYVIASVGLTKTLKMYDLRSGKLIFDENMHEPLNCVDIILNGDQVAVGTTGGDIIVYDLRGVDVLQTIKAHQSPVLCVKTQNLNIPKTYQEVEMKTPDVVDNQSKTLDISVMDVFSPISGTAGKDASNGYLNMNKTSFHSTPISPNSKTAYEDSFLRKVLSPNMIPTSQSSPYLCPIIENAEPNEEKYFATPRTVKEEAESEVSNLGRGDGFHLDNPAERNLYYSDIIAEIKNSHKEVLSEINSIKREVSEMRTAFDKKCKFLLENYENLSNLLTGGIRQEIYGGNCDAKIEHIAHRILINELNETVNANADRVSDQVKLNALRLQHIYDILKNVK